MSKTTQTAHKRRLEEVLQPGKKVKLVGIPKPGSPLYSQYGEGHASFMAWDGSVFEFCIPIDPRTGHLKKIFTEEEERVLADELNLDMDYTSASSDLHKRGVVRIIIDEQFKLNGISFDMGVLEQLFKVRILQAQKNIAPSWADRFERPGYRWALVEVGHEDKERSHKVQKAMKAYRHIEKVKDDREALYELLCLYSWEKDSAKPSKTASMDKLLASIYTVIESDIDFFMGVIEDPMKDVKMVVTQGLSRDLITYDPTIRGYVFTGDKGVERVGSSFAEIVSYFEKDRNSADKQILLAKLKE